MPNKVNDSRLPAKLILASSSLRRKWLLESAHIQFEIEPADIDEQAFPNERPEDYANRMAQKKALQIFKRHQDKGHPCAVLGADTIVVIDGKYIGKPKDKNDARTMLQTLSARIHQVITGVCLITANGKEHKFQSKTDVTFKRLFDSEIDIYLERADWLDKAGAYAIQEDAGYMVKSIYGSYTNVVGLPLCETVELLNEHGISKIDQ